MGAALDLCLLSLASRKPRYGYEMVELLANSAVGPVNEGTVYPLLRRQAYLKERSRAFLGFAEGVKSILDGDHEKEAALDSFWARAKSLEGTTLHTPARGPPSRWSRSGKAV